MICLRGLALQSNLYRTERGINILLKSVYSINKDRKEGEMINKTSKSVYSINKDRKEGEIVT